MANAADIIVNLVAKTARFERGINRANRRLGTMAKAARTTQFAIKSLAAGLLALGAGRIRSVARQQIQLAANLDRVSKTVGFTVEQIQELRFASEQMQIQTNVLDLGIQRLSRRLGEAAQGTGELLGVAEKYNVTLRNSDGSMRDNIDLLGDFADIIAKTEDEQEQLRIAFKLFDSEGASLVQLLREGRSGLDRFRTAAHDMGVIVDSDLIAKGAEAEKQMDALASVIQAKLLVAVTENIDPMIRLAEATAKVAEFGLNAAAGISDFATRTGQKAAEVLHGNADGWDAIAEEMRELDRVARGVRDPWDLFFGGPTQEEMDNAQTRLDFLNAAFERSLIETSQMFDQAIARAKARRDQILAGTPITPEAPAPIRTDGVEEVDITDTLLRVNKVMKDRQRIASLINQTRTQEELILSNIRFITEQIHAGEGNVNELMEVRRRLFDELRDSIGSNFDQMTRLEEMGVQAARNMQTAMADFIAGSADGFAGLLNNFRTMLVRMVAELMARKILLSFLGGLAKGGGPFAGFASKVLGDMKERAAGGPVSGGSPYLVGERGPELFVPNRSGRIIPRGGRGTAGGASVVINQNNVFNSEGGLNPEDLIPILEENGRKVKAELMNELDRGAFA